MDFLIGGIAASCAGVFSNPFDVIKTRQQLQGELQKNTSNVKKPYGTSWQAIKSIVQAEGYSGLQKGLGPALAFQFVMNSTRLGSYETVDQLNWTRFNGSASRSTILCVFWGGVCGVIGSAVGCPLYMIKIQIQSQSHGEFAVGFQHNHSGMIDALKQIYRQNGFSGLFRGFEGIVPRALVGSSMQMSSFSTSMDILSQYETFQQSTYLTPLFASLISGLFLCIGMTPFDVVSTRLFNQGADKDGKGLLYRNVFDCFIKTFKAEGMRGLYKGFVANYYRCAPHTMLCLTFWDLFKKLKNNHLSYEAIER